jgi:hypothetical protein
MAEKRPPAGQSQAQGFPFGVKHDHVHVDMLKMQLLGLFAGFRILRKVGHELEMSGEGMIHEQLEAAFA